MLNFIDSYERDQWHKNVRASIRGGQCKDAEEAIAFADEVSKADWARNNYLNEVGKLQYMQNKESSENLVRTTLEIEIIETIEAMTAKLVASRS